MIVGSDGLCQAHSPRHAGMRKRRARASSSAGGGSLALFEEIHQRIDDLYAKVLEDEIPSAVGAVCNQLLQTKLRAIEFERKIKETDELEARVAALEASEAEERNQNTNGKRGARRWP